MNPYDYQTLKEHAPHYTAELAIRFGAEVGLRVSETTEVTADDIHESTHPDVDAYFIGVYGKDTSGKLGDMGKYRDAFLPYDLFNHVMAHSIKEGIAPGEPQFGVTKRTVQQWIKDAAEAAAESTGNSDYNKISSHDLRAYFATDCLIRRDMNVRVVMEVGGWADYKSMQPYLNAQFDDVIAEEFEQAGID